MTFSFIDPLSEGTAAPEKVKCGECGVLFATKRYLRQHVANKHSKRSRDELYKNRSSRKTDFE